jgi:CubicO group peptidase (beta-lactamase class C family)
MMPRALASRAAALAIAAAAAACHPHGHPAAPAPGPTGTGPAPLPAAAALDAGHLDAQLTPFVQAFGKKLGESRAFSGLVVVAQHDRPVYAHGFGYADRATHAVPDLDTSFRIGSVTKQFTSAAIMLLVQDGKLSVDQPIATYLPDYPAVGAKITLHQLLTHTSGLPDYTEAPGFMEHRGEPHTVAELLHVFWSQPLRFAPGAKFEYSNSNYIVLGAIIEKVSGMPYADFMAKRVFGPAGLTRTVVGDAEGARDRALGYQPGAGGLVAADKIDMTVPFAAGAVRSTAADLIRWNRVLAGEALLTAASKQRMYTVEKDDYAYGWLIKDAGGHRVIGHNGGIDGFQTVYLRIPDLDAVIVVWCNNSGVHPDPVADAALAVALGGKVQPIEEPDLVPLDPAAADRIAGHYQLSPASRAAASKMVPASTLDTLATLDVTHDGDHLTIKPVGQDAVPLDAVSPTRYIQIDLGVSVEAALPQAGPATGLTIRQGGLSLVFDRAPAPAAPADPYPQGG